MAFELRDHNEPLLTLEELPGAVQRALEEFFASRRSELSRIGTPVTEAAEYLERFVLEGGKRIRPLYLWAGFVGPPRNQPPPKTMLPSFEPLPLWNSSKPAL